MNTIFLGLLAETFIHPGAGATEGAIDLPVAREGATDYPFIAGSSLKGALLDKAEQANRADPTQWAEQRRDDLFGNQKGAGKLLISDARLLALPVRSLTGSYKWATCRYVLERLHRDRQRCSGGPPTFTLPSTIAKKTVLAASTGPLRLEERTFAVDTAPDKTIFEVVKSFISHAEVAGRVNDYLIIMNDDDFAWFARFGLAVQARNVLRDNKTSKNLWYEETLPPDTLMYAMIGERVAGSASQLRDLFQTNSYLQVGGNETVGHGWFAVKVL